jgi:hypothetical protein
VGVKFLKKTMNGENMICEDLVGRMGFGELKRRAT